MEFWVNGYWAIVLIALFSILCLGVFIEKLFYLSREKKDFLENMRKFKLEDVSDIVFLDTIIFNCNSSIVLAKDLIKEYKDICEYDVFYLEEKLKEIVFKKMRKIEEKLWLLKITAALSPMIGLLGTVLGMMVAFGSIANSGADSKIVAQGINGALVTTAAGLIAAIPAIFFYNYLVERNDMLIGDMKKVGIEIINSLKKRKMTDE
ncbi:MAG: MotA/TolQ/ExbB proton channel family protein [Fusobacteriaceae bacterium]|nr:MotA/TolQ/ExbB proton channel family protein [Fusobacteriaceae bacterium]